MTHRLLALLSVCLVCCNLTLQAKRTTEAEDSLQCAVKKYFEAYSANNYRPLKKMAVDNCLVDTSLHKIIITANEFFCSQPFTPGIVEKIYAELRHVLPHSYSDYELSVCSKAGRSIEHHVPNHYRAETADPDRLWKEKDYKGAPWVSRISRPYTAPKGLEGRHLLLSPSHGIVFRDGIWKWQRPYLFCTTEDLYTQSLAFPYLLPMLENAGATVFTTRERDMQTAEVIVDNDAAGSGGTYRESSDKHEWRSTEDSTGYAPLRSLIYDRENPFRGGTCKYTAAHGGEQATATAQWIPNIPESGAYSVYVSYRSFPESVDDAHYAVYHKGGKTEFKVNQQMGGGTWVYLGTFHFDAGMSDSIRVELSNATASKGLVCADAVKFGGGTGKHFRANIGTSGLPHYLEASRYYAQRNGFSPSVYNSYEKNSEYYDDIRTRPNMANQLSGGSVYNPDSCGLKVPLELSIALHTDAGWRTDNSVYGTLGISTSKDGLGNYSFPSGLSRYASADLTDVVMTSVVDDLTAFLGKEWTRRERYDRNYGETRLADIPATIVEMLSHQNFTDLRYAYDPAFKFVLARSIYKGILHYVSTSHGIRDYVVQPLPVSCFAAEINEANGQAYLSWQKTSDPNEASAEPTAYIVYTKINDGAFDNGQKITTNEVLVNITPGTQYSFKITAINAGGESFPSEVLSVYIAPHSTAKALIVNGFTRLSAPAFVCQPDSVGFLLHEDIGVPYISTSAFSGAQLYFDPSNPLREGKEAFGYSGSELQGKTISGNTFDYPVVHGHAMTALKDVSFSSCSKEAVRSRKILLSDYNVVDYICGLERDVAYNLIPAKTLDAEMQSILSSYLRSGGALLLSGSHIGKDLHRLPSDRKFAEKMLKYKWEGSSDKDSSNYVVGLQTQLPIRRTASPERYYLQSPDILMPSSSESFPIFLYGEGSSAGIAYPGRDYRVVALGFPFECIADEYSRAYAMQALLGFLLAK